MSPSKYLDHAHDCRSLAASLTEPAQREQLLRVAAQWERLAGQHAEYLIAAESFDRETELMLQVLRAV